MQDSARVTARYNIKKSRSESGLFWSVFTFFQVFAEEKHVCLDCDSLYMSGLQTVLYYSDITVT